MSFFICPKVAGVTYMHVINGPNHYSPNFCSMPVCNWNRKYQREWTWNLAVRNLHSVGKIDIWVSNYNTSWNKLQWSCKIYLQSWGKGSLNPPMEVRKSFPVQLAIQLVTEEQGLWSHAEMWRSKGFVIAGLWKQQNGGQSHTMRLRGRQEKAKLWC